jgi:hypothetical protein
MKTNTIIWIVGAIVVGVAGYMFYKEYKKQQEAKKVKAAADAVKNVIVKDALNNIKPVTDTLNTLSMF